MIGVRDNGINGQPIFKRILCMYVVFVFNANDSLDVIEIDGVLLLLMTKFSKFCIIIRIVYIFQSIYDTNLITYKQVLKIYNISLKYCYLYYLIK